MEPLDLRLQIGESLHLQTRDGDEARRLHVRVIGYLPGHSLVVATPRVNNKVMIMREGQPFVVRVLVGNRVVGFTTRVLRSCARPYPYLHLEYPQEMEQIVVRKAPRVRVKLFASLKNENPAYKFDKPHSATVVDISTSGAQLLADAQLGEVGDAVSITSVIKVGEAEKLLTIPAKLRNVHVEHPEEGPGEASYSHGLEFRIANQDDLFVLHGYVYEQIIKSQSD